jgi:hypothetical protein
VLKIRPLTESDYEDILLSWWEGWKWTAPSKDFLPDNGKSGMIVYDGDEPICAGFLYLTNSQVAWVDWIISSPIYRKKPERKDAILYLISTLTELAKQTGHKYSYALIKHKSLISSYEDIGYSKSDTYQFEMIKVL